LGVTESLDWAKDKAWHHGPHGRGMIINAFAVLSRGVVMPIHYQLKQVS